MPRITMITLEGFKSFARKTTVKFPVDFSVVVGGNGSGKSNIVDALCFVMGTARSRVMRIKNSAELIYNGGKDGKAAKRAEVVISFDNTDAGLPIDTGTVTVSRTVISSGQSVYRLNGKKVTRQKVRELLSRARIDPDSYNIVLQNDVTGVVHMSPRERRGFIDEIAGIASYEERKERALKELESVEGNLRDTQTRLSEVRRTLDMLKGERDRALKLKQLKEEELLVEATLCRSRTKRDEGLIARQRERIAELEGERAKAIALRQEEESVLAKRQAALSEVERQLDEEGHGDKLRLTEEKAGINGEINTLKERRKARGEELEGRTRRIETLREDLAKNASGLGKAKKELIELSRREKELTGEITRVERRVRKQRREQGEEWAALDRERETLEKDVASLATKETEIREELANIQGILKGATGKRVRLDDLRSELATLTREEGELTTTVSTSEEESGQLTRDISDTGHTLEKKEQEYERVRERLERQARMTREVEAVLNSGMDGVVGRVYDLVKFSLEHSAAIMAVAGPWINAVVVERDVHAVACVNMLKEKRIGKARFLPMDKIRTPRHSKEAEGVGREGLGLLRDYVRCEPYLEPVLRYILGNTVLVETIEDARRIGFGRARMVSLDGDIVGARGAVHGGHQKTDRITTGIGALHETIGRMKAEISTMTQRKDELDALIIEMRRRRAEVKTGIGAVQAELEDLEDVDAAGLEKREEELTKELASVEGKLARRRAKLADVQKRASASSRRQASEELEKDEGCLATLRKELVEVGTARTEKEQEKKHVFEANIARYKELLREEQKAVSAIRAEVAGIDKQLAAKADELGKVQAELVDMDEKLEYFFNKRNAAHGEVRLSEDRIKTLDNEATTLAYTLESESEELGKMEGKLDEMRCELKRFSEFLPDDEDQSVSHLEGKLRSIQQRIDRIGGVSDLALVRYEDRETEYNESLERKTQLEKERKVILGTMEELETRKKEVFMEAFTVVRGHYRSVISSIEGWSGDLSLEDEDDPFEGGLVLQAHPRGKRLTRLEAMSGGEKVLTALSLLLALQKYDDAPFLVLDEVDAALDKVNLERFTDMLRDTASRSQLIVVTHHNEPLMRSAQQLIGVSIRDGRSKILGVNLGEFPVVSSG